MHNMRWSNQNPNYSGKFFEERKKGKNLESSETPIKMQISTLWLTLLGGSGVQKKSQWNIPDFFFAPLHFHELFKIWILQYITLTFWLSFR